MSRQRLIWAIAGILLAAVTVWVHYEVKVNLVQAADPMGGSVEESGNLSVGEEISDFSSVDLDGADVILSEFQNSEVVVLDFWATWCRPCIYSMPSLEALNEEFEYRGAQFLAVNVGESPELVREFVEDTDFTVRVVIDEHEEISDAYGVRGIPQLVVVGKDGRVAHIEVGYPPFAGLAEQRENRLRELLDDLIRQGGA
ncbi:MAG: TlpA disulfide reductase family protein [Gammaproteobacteria bacterium]|nr:TlpA disulfide reductase family protein [Gammaproteobacteria bacterium]MDE0413898.1 TlpA disulfide reductase family protein [Gammaproteobacteria bacterium]